MKQTMKHTLEMTIRAEDFLDANPFTPAIPAATALATQLTAGIQKMLAQGAGQVGGRFEMAAGVGERRTLSRELRTMLSDLVRTAKSIDLAAHPEAAEVRAPRGGSYQALRNTAQAVMAVVTTAKAAFVELDWPTTVDTDLSTLIDAFDAALSRKNNGLATKVGSTTGLTATARKTVAVVRKLDAIVRKRFKADPGLIAAWKSATHIERPPRSKKSAPATPSLPAADAPTLPATA
jgi:hypothetical protein